MTQAPVSAPVIGFVSTRHGIGKTTLVYNLAWMLAGRGWRVLTADFDPQADLTADFLFVGAQHEPWATRRRAAAMWDTLELHAFEEGPFLLAGDPRLAAEEDDLARAWLEVAAGSVEALRRTTALPERVRREARAVNAHVVLVDLSSSLGALNRAALVGCDHVILAVTRDIASTHLLPILFDTLDRWRNAWRTMGSGGLALTGSTTAFPTAGCVVLGRGQTRVLPRDENLMYHLAENMPVEQVINATVLRHPRPHCLGVVKDYPALVELSREAGKPMFALKSADGAMGAHAQLVVEAYRNFREIAEALAERCGLPPRPAD